MDVSAKREARLGQQMYNATMQEYGPKILPPSHPVSQHVTAVVRRILQSSGLGHIRGELARVDGTINQGLSHPDERLNFDVGTRSDGSSGKAQQKEWTVHVVQDDEPNAEAAIGAFPLCLPSARAHRAFQADTSSFTRASFPSAETRMGSLPSWAMVRPSHRRLTAADRPWTGSRDCARRCVPPIAPCPLPNADA